VDEVRRQQFCGACVVSVEEKIDGANLGISLDSSYTPRMQARSKLVNWNTDLQFAGLEQWLAEHSQTLSEILERNNDILFGEWCAYLHTVKYSRLPGYFVAFDIYDCRAGRFLSRRAFHTRLQRASGLKIPAVPTVCAPRIFRSVAEVEALLTKQSAFADEVLEGVYLRIDEVGGSASAETYLKDRCKLVRAEFQQAIVDHGTWRGQGKNKLDIDFGLTYAEASYTSAQPSGGAAGLPASSSAAAAIAGAAAASAAAGADGVQEEFGPVRSGSMAASDPLRGKLSNPRSKHTVKVPELGEVELPRNFSFLLGDCAVSSTPTRQEHIQAMRSLDIGLVVTLTEETPLPADWFQGSGVRNLFVPVPNYHPPTVPQAQMILEEVAEAVAAGQKAMVHCGGGKGRAGTVAACVIMRYGVQDIASTLAAERESECQELALCSMQSNEVMEYLRDARPGSIETERQERFLRTFASQLRQLDFQQPRSAEASVVSPLAGTGSASSSTAAAGPGAATASFAPEARAKAKGGAKDKASQKEEKEAEKRLKAMQKRAPKYLMMCGLAGSGKSTFCKALEASGPWTRANQDDLGRRACEELVRKQVPLVRQGATHIVVDRCHLTVAERAEWLDLLGGPSAKEVTCVHFDFPVEQCQGNAAARLDHPTIRSGGGARIIEAQAKKLERPATSEGFGAVEVVQSFEQAAALLRRFGAVEAAIAYEAQAAAAAAGVNGNIDVASAALASAGDASLGDAAASAATADDAELARDSTGFTAEFAHWLRIAMEEELPKEDVEAIWDGVVVILEGAAEDAEAMASAEEVLRDSGAPSCADRLAAKWQSSHTR